VLVGAVGQRVTCRLAHRAVPLTLTNGPRLGPAVEKFSCAQQRKQFGHELRVNGRGLVVVEQEPDLVNRFVPVHRHVGRQRDVLRINLQERVGTHWPQPPHRGAQACNGALRLGMWPQHRADPQSMHRPALQCEQCDQSPACRRQVDRAVTVVNGELTEQVKREVIRHTLIVDLGSAEGMRSALLVFQPVALRLLRSCCRENRVARRIESWIGLGCQPSALSALP